MDEECERNGKVARRSNSACVLRKSGSACGSRGGIVALKRMVTQEQNMKRIGGESE